MSISDSKNYFRVRMTALGFKEWSDGFNFDNIPSTLINKSFSLTLTGANGSLHDNTCIKSEPNFMLRVFLKGFRDPKTILDEALVQAELIIQDLVSIPQRTAEPTVWNVHYDSLDLKPIETNDNAIIIEIGLRCQVMMDTN